MNLCVTASNLYLKTKPLVNISYSGNDIQITFPTLDHMVLILSKIQKETHGRAAVWIICDLISGHSQILLNHMHTESWLCNLAAHNDIKLSLINVAMVDWIQSVHLRLTVGRRWWVDPKAQHSARLRWSRSHDSAVTVFWDYGHVNVFFFF